MFDIYFLVSGKIYSQSREDAQIIILQRFIRPRLGVPDMWKGKGGISVSVTSNVRKIQG